MDLSTVLAPEALARKRVASARIREISVAACDPTPSISSRAAGSGLEDPQTAQGARTRGQARVDDRRGARSSARLFCRRFTVQATSKLGITFPLTQDRVSSQLFEPLRGEAPHKRRLFVIPSERERS